MKDEIGLEFLNLYKGKLHDLYKLLYIVIARKFSRLLCPKYAAWLEKTREVYRILIGETLSTGTWEIEERITLRWILTN
jgi:hypothetical protein